MIQIGGGWPLQLNPSSTSAWADVFTDQECDKIISSASQEMQNAPVFNAPASVRVSSVQFLYPSVKTEWIFQRLSQMVNGINAQYFNFDLTGFIEGLQFTQYQAPNAHYDWHCDMGPGDAPRKLSLTIQLSDPKDYEGGDLQISPDGNDISLQFLGRERGRAFLFPSWMPHRVTPVTEGVRYSLVAWITGPPFR